MSSNTGQPAWASAKCTDAFICINTYSGYGISQLDPQGRQHLLPPEGSADDIGVAVLDSLAHSRVIDPDKDEGFYDYQAMLQRYEDWVSNLMALYGCETRHDLFKNMKSCQIKLRDGIITILPSHHEVLEGWGGEGIEPEDYVVIPANSSPRAVGQALRLAFSRCR
jgi:hypothetical protein